MTTGITGPNDASGIVWALLGMFFFCFSSCFLLLANDFYLFRSSLFFSGTRRAMVAGDDHNGPKRRQMHRLGLRYVFFFPRVFSLLTNKFYFDLGPHYVLKAPKELQWVATTITGPNDASGVVWALGRRS